MFFSVGLYQLGPSPSVSQGAMLPWLPESSGSITRPYSAGTVHAGAQLQTYLADKRVDALLHELVDGDPVDACRSSSAVAADTRQRDSVSSVGLLPAPIACGTRSRRLLYFARTAFVARFRSQSLSDLDATYMASPAASSVHAPTASLRHVRGFPAPRTITEALPLVEDVAGLGSLSTSLARRFDRGSRVHGKVLSMR